MRVNWYEKVGIKTNGEIIKELLSGEEHPIGIALAEVKEARLHYHRKTREYYIVLRGEGKLILEEEELPLKEGDLVYIEPMKKHKAKTEKGKLEILVISCPPWSKEDHFEVE